VCVRVVCGVWRSRFGWDLPVCRVILSKVSREDALRQVARAPHQPPRWWVKIMGLIIIRTD
jgi:hypothetical protein